MTSTKADFVATLLPDDLVAATVISSSKLHLIRMRRTVSADMVKGEPTDETLSRLVDGRSLCEANPRFFWRPTNDVLSWPEAGRCIWCFQRWRALKRPLVKGWTDQEATVAGTLRLPFGWQEITVRHDNPLDLPKDAPDPDDDDEKKEGARRVEVRRWVRGPRYVRLVQMLKDERFCVRYGLLGRPPHEEDWWLKSDHDKVLAAAVTLMALGGTVAHRTSDEKMTLTNFIARAR